MIKTTKFIMIYIGLSAFLCSCENPIEKQVDYLLPDTNTLELISKKETGITCFNIYKVSGDINTNELSQFPENVISKNEKVVIKWHKPTNNEIRDIRLFLEEEQSHNEFATKLLNEIPMDNYLMALIYDKDKSPLGIKGYSVYDWMELYFLDLTNKKLIHISYGKF